jgi:hypothetical protein
MLLTAEPEVFRSNDEPPTTDMAERTRTLVRATEAQNRLCSGIAVEIRARLRARVNRPAGFAALLDAVLPADEDDFDFLAARLDLSPNDFTGIRFGRVDPLLLGPQALAEIAVAFHIPTAAMRALIAADRATLPYGEHFIPSGLETVGGCWADVERLRAERRD